MRINALIFAIAGLFASHGSAQEAPQRIGSWEVESGLSPLNTLHTNFYASTGSLEGFIGSGGTERRATLRLQCVEERIDLIVAFGGELAMGREGYVAVEYWIDDQPSRSGRMITDSPWSYVTAANGGEVIEALSNAKAVKMRFSYVTDDTFDLSFDLTGIEQVVPEMEAACA